MNKPWSEMLPREKDAFVAQAMGYEVITVTSELQTIRHRITGATRVLLHFTLEYQAARLVEEEIERQNLVDRYIEALVDILETGNTNIYGDQWEITSAALFLIRRATPDQICRAALVAFGVEVQ